MKNWLIIVCGLAITFGCARIRTDFAPLDVKLMTTKPKSAIQLTTGDIDQPYKELGVIVVRGRRIAYEKIVEELQSKAREIGAEAVIKIEVGNRFGYSRRPYGRGVAIVFE